MTPTSNTIQFNSGAIGQVVLSTPSELLVKLSTPPSAQGPLTAVVSTPAGSSGAPVQVGTVGAPSTASNQPPTVTQSTTSLAQNATTILISGTGFDGSNPAGNIVIFNLGAIGKVTAATQTQLVVSLLVPPTCTGPLTATVVSFFQSSGTPVQVANVVPAPVVFASSTPLAHGATSLIILGANFDPLPAGNTVVLSNGTVATVVLATPSQLTLQLTTPQSCAGPLTAVVTSFGGSSGAPVVVAVGGPVSGTMVAPAAVPDTVGGAQDEAAMMLAGGSPP